MACRRGRLGGKKRLELSARLRLRSRVPRISHSDDKRSLPIMPSVTAFAPATVSNVACGFDVLGFALGSPGDEVMARFAPSGVRIDDIVGDGGRLPRDGRKNTAGVAAAALLSLLGERRGVTLTVRKGLPLSSGL